ncbi:multicopper oxidase domain-containing protein [Brevibacterium sp. FAM 27836]|uniref:multicopper oxidase domain-containing protein n=1 Tax=Brevibacterium sp. FAM 27836 TaxID=3446693 RepID=UPI003F50ED5B
MSPQLSSPRERDDDLGIGRGRWLIRDIPVVIWLVFLLVIIAAHPGLPVARWLMIHLLVLGAVSHSILVWSQHFAQALLHTPSTAASRRSQSLRLGLLNIGTLVVIIGMMAGIWALVILGAAAVVAAVVWHGASLWNGARHALASRFAGTLHYYVAAAGILPVGVTFGVILADDLADPWHSRLLAAHALLNLLGWIGLTVIGTLMTLWPTMLRTKIVPGAEVAARRALPLLLTGLVIALAATLFSAPWAAGIGLLAYLAGIGLIARPFVLSAAAKPPREYPTYSAAAAIVWLVICLLATAWVFFTSADWTSATHGFTWLTPALAAGFAAQILFGALSYLLPVVLGGGPTAVRAANREFNRLAAFRITIINLGLAICLLPVPSWVRVLCSGLVALGLALFLPFLFRGLRASRKAKANPDIHRTKRPTKEQRAAASKLDDRRALASAAAGMALVLVAVAGGVALDPNATTAVTARAASAGVTPTGETTTVRVEAKDMRFSPDSVDVPAGNRLVIELKNTDDQDVHDLVLDNGVDSGRLSPGESATVDVGIVGEDLEGWCSIAGHRQMGMVFAVNAIGGAGENTAAGHDDSGGSGDSDTDGMAGMDHGDHGGMEHGSGNGTSGSEESAAGDLDFMAEPGADLSARDARLPQPDESEKSKTIKKTFTVTEEEREVAVGVKQKLWLFNGTMPGPTLRGKVGDRFEITLVNDGSMGHSIDFHAGELAPDQPMRTIAPGESLTYTFTATHSGAWMYHCATMPMTDHIANGMFGAVIIDPPKLPEVDREYFMVQSELYLGPQGGIVDSDKAAREEPDAVVFNGFANQYDHDQLKAKVGERVRIWVVDAGPNRPSAFHIIGGQFDTVFKEGAYRLKPDNEELGASQTLDLAASQGGFVELEFAEAGHYPFVSHVMVDAERGAHGIVDVTD